MKHLAFASAATCKLQRTLNSIVSQWREIMLYVLSFRCPGKQEAARYLFKTDWRGDVRREKSTGPGTLRTLSNSKELSPARSPILPSHRHIFMFGKQGRNIGRMGYSGEGDVMTTAGLAGGRCAPSLYGLAQEKNVTAAIQLPTPCPAMSTLCR